MSFYQYLKDYSVVDIEATDKGEAIKELSTHLMRILKVKRHKAIVDDILKREENATSFIGQGVAIPFGAASLKDDEYALIVGRSREGVQYDAARGAHAHLIILLLAQDPEDSQLVELRSEIATFFKSDSIQTTLLEDEESVDLSELVSTEKKEVSSKKTIKKSGDPIITTALALAKEVKASALVFFADVVENQSFIKQIKTKSKVIIVTSNKSLFDEDEISFADFIQAPFYPTSRTEQMKTGILLSISRNLINKKDRIVCVSGDSRIGEFDTIVTVDVEREFEFFFSTAKMIIPPDVKPEVLERILGLASEIAVEGREGKPIGTIFVVGDTNSVNANIRQLIINPFRGYSEAERNILDPGLDETIKEFSSIDGAFIVTGDGVLLSAGSYLKPPVETTEKIPTLPGGFGTRHVAAAGITVCSSSLAITISESTGMISIFKNGAIVLTISRPVTTEKITVR